MMVKETPFLAERDGVLLLVGYRLDITISGKDHVMEKNRLLQILTFHPNTLLSKNGFGVSN